MKSQTGVMAKKLKEGGKGEFPYICMETVNEDSKCQQFMSFTRRKEWRRKPVYRAECLTP